MFFIFYVNKYIKISPLLIKISPFLSFFSPLLIKISPLSSFSSPLLRLVLDGLHNFISFYVEKRNSFKFEKPWDSCCFEHIRFLYFFLWSVKTPDMSGVTALFLFWNLFRVIERFQLCIKLYSLILYQPRKAWNVNAHKRFRLCQDFSNYFFFKIEKEIFWFMLISSISLAKPCKRGNVSEVSQKKFD